MKKFISILGVVIISITLCSCGPKDDNSSVVEVASVAEKTEGVKPAVTDAALDPQNGEIGRPLGETVNITEIAPKKGVHNGIDVSKWQGKIDWKKVKNQGIDFAVIRIGFRGENGSIYKDEYADYNIQQANKAGVLVGVYFFSTAINQNEADSEAEWVKENIKNYPISLPVVYDCEGFNGSSGRMYGLTVTQRTDNALKFISNIKASGYETMFYGSKNDLEKNWETGKIENVSKIWIAHYDGIIYPQAQNPQYSGKYSMWQYTNKGRVAGVSGDVDLVVSYEAFSKKLPKQEGEVKEATAPKPVDNNYKTVNDSVTAKDVVNLREAATTTSTIVGKLNAGEYLERTAIGTNGWSKLNFGGKTVYAVSSYLTNEQNYIKPPVVSQTPSDGFTATDDKVTPKESVNLRREPTTKSDIVAEVPNGTVLDRIAENTAKGWSRLTYNGETVYAVTRYLTTDLTYKPNVTSEPPQKEEMYFFGVDEQVTAKSETNLRSNPAGGNASQVVYLLKNGEYVQRTGKSNEGWSRVIWNGQTLYAVTSYLEVKP